MLSLLRITDEYPKCSNDPHSLFSVMFKCNSVYKLLEVSIFILGADVLIS